MLFVPYGGGSYWAVLGGLGPRLYDAIAAYSARARARPMVGVFGVARRGLPERPLWWGTARTTGLEVSVIHAQEASPSKVGRPY